MKIAFTLTCPKCGGHNLEHVTNDDPKGWVSRERRLVVACHKPYCAWSGVIVTELIDLTQRKGAA